ncbi:LacI family DNA-binding transcriptional regulator [Acuticoccus mangrovi]|uniref:Substrate-binding domain-containing protein n=1 Tax=Acuticoccus mangrovi TaxID=2796142 RepID=A0A934INB7_9HYPH|nr:substrate-binding domain-containing protein [Acuticoccus mangrovi]MBJ3774549.1 substrate-binding domain-containing protein [Acuticoccus mangrovi]
MRKTVGRITIKDVAEAAGVSVGTASRVINNKATVRPEIRSAVLSAIDRLDYQPNAVAQSMRRRSTQLVGCIIREINIPALAAFVRAAHDELDQAGYSLVISNSEGRRAREEELIHRFGRLQSDGMLLGPYTPVDPAYEKLLRGFGAPIVLFDRNEPEWADAVAADHAGSIDRATSRLLDLGHRRIAILTGNPLLFPAAERIRGYRRAFQRAGLAVDESLVRGTGFLAAEGFRNASSLLASAAPPTALISGGIDMLPGVLRAIRVRGLSIPDDISVVGSGDSELAELHTPPISVERWDMAETGRTAALLLLRRIGGERDTPPEHVLLPAEFVERASLAPPRQS